MKLSDYQVEAVGRLLAARTPTPTFGVYDPPGAGKTAVAINALQELGRFPAVITCPAHLVLQWREQLILWGIPAEEISYTPRGMSLAKRLAQLENEDTAFSIVSYHMWSNTNYWPYLLQRRQKAYVFDEAHRLRKGRHGKKGWWETVNWLRTKTRSTHLQTPLWLLSGTPMVKDATDMWPLLHFAAPQVYRSREQFARQYCHTSDTPYGMHVGKLYDPPKFRKLIGRYSIRRSYSQIPELADLECIYTDLPVELTQQELNRHRKIKNDYRDPVTNEPLTNSAMMIHALRRLTVEPKIKAFLDLTDDHPGRWLVLCWYRDTASLLYDACTKKFGRDNVGVITGASSELARDIARRTYTGGGILIGTIAALAEGLNLQQGNQVAFVEQHWLSTENEQALARVLRRGQRKPVIAYTLYAPKTFDMRVRKVASNRKSNIEVALDEYLAEI